MRRHPRLVLPVLAVAVLGLAACGGEGGSTDQLEQNLAAQQEAIDALRTRVTDLTDEVRQVSAIDPETGLSDLTGQLEDLTTRLETVETSVAEQGNQEDVTAVVAAEVGKFSEQIDELVASVRDLTTVVSQVQSDVDELQQRFDDHRGDPFGHNRGDTDPE